MQVFWLTDFPNICAFPFPFKKQWQIADFVPFTAAGPRPVLTDFPFNLQKPVREWAPKENKLTNYKLPRVTIFKLSTIFENLSKYRLF